MDTVTVQFTNVGPKRLTWICDLPRPLTYHSMFKAVKAVGALGSRDIEFDDNGHIYVGTIRRVGDWSIVAEAR